MRRIAISAFAAISLAPSPLAAQRESAPPPLTPVAGGRALLTDVSSSHAQMEKNIEAQYAKLLKEARGQKTSLEDKIKDIDRQIAALKEQAKKIEEVARKLQELLPTIMAGVGGDRGGVRRTPANGDQLASLLASERAKAGLPSTPGFPTLTPGDYAAASALPGSQGAAFLSARIADQASQKIHDIDKAIDALKKKIKTSREEIAALDKEIAKLEADKAKTIAELRKQKEKALAEATEAQDSRLVRIPTPTPTPKKR